MLTPGALAAPLPEAPGCPVFPASSVWNKPVNKLPLQKNSAAIVKAIGAGLNVHADFGSGLWDGGPIGIPVTVVDSAQPKSPVDFHYDDESDPGPYPIPTDVAIEGGPAADGDRHAIIVDRDSCTLYELFDLHPAWDAGSGAIWNMRSNALRPRGWTSADAAGLPILAGLARYDEVASGVIDHALRFTVKRSRRAFIYPARHFAIELHKPQPSAHGSPSAPPRQLPRGELPTAGARRPPRVEALRDDRRRQRVELVHLGRPRPRLEQRPAAHAPPREGLGLPGREHVEAEALALESGQLVVRELDPGRARPATFSSRCGTEAVPGIGTTTGDRARSQASAIWAGVTPRASATRPRLPPGLASSPTASGYQGKKAMPSRSHSSSTPSDERSARL